MAGPSPAEGGWSPTARVARVPAGVWRAPRPQSAAPAGGDAIRPRIKPPGRRPTRVVDDVAGRSTWDAVLAARDGGAPDRQERERPRSPGAGRTGDCAPRCLPRRCVTVTLTAAGPLPSPEASLDCADLVVDRVYRAGGPQTGTLRSPWCNRGNSRSPANPFFETISRRCGTLLHLRRNAPQRRRGLPSAAASGPPHPATPHPHLGWPGRRTCESGARQPRLDDDSSAPAAAPGREPPTGTARGGWHASNAGRVWPNRNRNTTAPIPDAAAIGLPPGTQRTGANRRAVDHVPPTSSDVAEFQRRWVTLP